MTRRSIKMIDVSLEEMWKQPMGMMCIIECKEYMYVGRDFENQCAFVDLSNNQQVCACDFPEDATVCITNANLAKLIDYKAEQVLILADEGWTLTGSMDLTKEFEELEVLKKLWLLLKGTESKCMV